MIDHKNRPRPLSPHLTVYKAEYSSMLSIYHRVTGILLAVFVLIVGLLFKIQAYNVEYFSIFVNRVLTLFVSGETTSLYLGYIFNTVVTFVVFAVVFMLAYHMSNGIRHFIWDYVLSTVSKDHVRSTSYTVILLTLVIFVSLVLVSRV